MTSIARNLSIASENPLTHCSVLKCHGDLRLNCVTCERDVTERASRTMKCLRTLGLAFSRSDQAGLLGFLTRSYQDSRSSFGLSLVLNCKAFVSRRDEKMDIVRQLIQRRIDMGSPLWALRVSSYCYYSPRKSL